MTIESAIAEAVAERIIPVIAAQDREIARLHRLVSRLLDKPLTLDETADATGMSRQTVVKHFRCGALKGVQRNGRYRFMPVDVEAFLSSRA